MESFNVGQKFFDNEGNYFQVTSMSPDGSFVFAKIETGNDYQYDSIVRDVPVLPKENIFISDKKYGYPHDFIAKMDGY